MRNPERALIAKHDRNHLSSLLTQAHERAMKLLQDPTHTIQEREFAPKVYSEDVVRRDIKEAQEIMRSVEAKRTPEEKVAKKISNILEAIVLEQSELNEWLGDAKTLKTSLYDDTKNKTDLIVEWYSPKDGSRVLALAFDISYGHRDDKLEQKIARVKEEVRHGTLGTIRYYKDSRGDFLGTRNNVPRVIVGIGKEGIEDVAAKWVKNENRTLAQHPAQRVFVEEIHMQLERMAGFAVKNNLQGPAQALQQALATIKPLRAKKSGIQWGTFRDDPVLNAIKNQVDIQFS